MKTTQLFQKVAVSFVVLIFATNISNAELRTSVSQYGITWTFSSARECGQFISGDWWVVGPVTILNVSPAPTSSMNGTHVNPVSNCKQGYDSRYSLGNFDASQRANYPMTLNGVTSVVSTVSNPWPQNCTTGGNPGWMNVIGDCQRGYLKSMAVLTVVNSVVPSGTFRPNYIGSTKYFYNVSQIDYAVLPSLPAPASLPDINRILRLFERPWLDHFGCWITQFIHAIDNAEGYGREMSNDVTEAALYLMTNGPQKDELVRRMVQRGIDVYGGVKNGASWPADGGHASGRKWTMLFAGKMLDDAGMLAGDGIFGEDLQTYYSGGLPWWRFAPGREGERMDYRTCCTSKTWVGQALTARMLHLDDNWGHNVYFEYVDRWVTQDVPLKFEYWGGNDGGYFSRDMWVAYRNNLPPEIPHGGGDTIPPTTPANLSITGSGITSVSLSWSASTDNKGIGGYKIYTNGANAVIVTSTSGTISGLTPATAYNFTVSALDYSGNESSQSAPINGSTLNATIIPAVATTASSYEAPDNVPANAIDGNLSTRWAADGDGQWLQVQLSSQANISAIELAFYLGTARTYNFEIQASTNGTTWTTIYNGSSSGTTDGLEEFDVTDATASYIRYLGHGNSVNAWNNVYEIKFYSAGPPDTEDPSVPTGLTVGTVTSSSVALSWNSSTDTGGSGLAGYKVYVNGANPQTFASNSGTVTGLTDNTPYTFTVSAYDNAGNESAQSSSVPATTLEITGVTSNSSWQWFNESTQTGTFTATFTSVPGGNNIDAVTGIQNGSAGTYSDLACIIRFNTGGTIDARDGGAYTASNTVSYTSGVSYAFRVEINVPSHTYSVYVTPQGGSEQTVATDFNFRSEQGSITQVTGWSVYAYSGSHTVDNMTFSTGVDTQPPTVPTGLVAGTITTTTVDLSWNASTDIGGSSVDGYKVYTNGANPVTVTGTSTTISGLTAATPYNFTVSAFDTESNESAQSAARVVTTSSLPDTQAPTVPTGLASGTVTSTNIALSWNTSTDVGGSGLAGYKVYTNGANPKTVTGTSTTMSGLASSTQYSFTVSAFDGASNESAQSSPVVETTLAPPSGATSSSTWQSFNLSTQTGTFTATFDATPNGNNIDAVTGIQNGAATAYGNLACIIRFNTSGTIDARDGGAYTASSTVSYTSGVSYAFRVEVNVPAHTYSVYVTPQGGSEQTVASNFDFRTEQTSVTQLTGWSLYAYVGSHTVSNMVFDDGSTPDTEAPSVPTGLASGTITSTSVALSWNASNDTGGSGLAGYKVYTDGTNPVTVTGTSTTITGLSAETQYSFTVSAFDGASNESAQSSAEVVTTDEIPTAIDLITNGEFDNGTTAWVAGNYGGTASLAAVTGQGMSGTNAMEISISAAGTNSWDIQIYQDIAIENGKTYEISFMAKAAASRTMAAVIQDTESPFSEYWHQDVNLTTSSQSFGPYTFNSSSTDATCRFKFFVAGNASTIYVDNIVVSDVTSSSGEVEIADVTPSFNIYPNPLNGNTLNVELHEYNDVVNVVIYDMMGKTLFSKVHYSSENTTFEIPVNKLTNGIYIISLHGRELVKQQTFIINR